MKIPIVQWALSDSVLPWRLSAGQVAGRAKGSQWETCSFLWLVWGGSRFRLLTNNNRRSTGSVWCSLDTPPHLHAEPQILCRVGNKKRKEKKWTTNKLSQINDLQRMGRTPLFPPLHLCGSSWHWIIDGRARSLKGEKDQNSLRLRHAIPFTAKCAYAPERLNYCLLRKVTWHMRGK